MTKLLVAMIAVVLFTSSAHAQTQKTAVRRATVNACQNALCTDAIVEIATDAKGVVTTWLWYSVYNETYWQIYAQETGRYITNGLAIIASDASHGSVNVPDAKIVWTVPGTDYTQDSRQLKTSTAGVISYSTETGIRRPAVAEGTLAGFGVDSTLDPQSNTALEVRSKTTR